MHIGTLFAVYFVFARQAAIFDAARFAAIDRSLRRFFLNSVESFLGQDRCPRDFSAAITINGCLAL